MSLKVTGTLLLSLNSIFSPIASEYVQSSTLVVNVIPVVFLLWGAYAKEKKKLIELEKLRAKQEEQKSKKESRTQEKLRRKSMTADERIREKALADEEKRRKKIAKNAENSEEILLKARQFLHESDN